MNSILGSPSWQVIPTNWQNSKNVIKLIRILKIYVVQVMRKIGHQWNVIKSNVMNSANQVLGKKKA